MVNRPFVDNRLLKKSAVGGNRTVWVVHAVHTRVLSKKNRVKMASVHLGVGFIYVDQLYSTS